MAEPKIPRLYDIATKAAIIIGAAAGVGMIEYSSYLHDVPLSLEKIASDLFFGLAGACMGMWASHELYVAHFCEEQTTISDEDKDHYVSITRKIVDKKTGYVLEETHTGCDTGWID